MISSDELSLSDVVSAVIRYRWLAAFVFLVTLAVVGFATLVCPKYFRSEAKLFARLGRENVGLDATATLGEGSTVAIPMTRESEINSIAEAIMSRTVIEKIVEEIGPRTILKPHKVGEKKDKSDDGPSIVDQVMQFLTQVGVLNDLSPRERAILRLEKRMEVEAVERTNIVEVSFDSRNPEVSQQIVESLVKHYLDHHRSVNRTSGALDFLTEQTHAIQRELAESEEALAKLKANGNVTTIEDSGRVRAARAGRVVDDLMQAIAKQKALESEVRRLEKQLSGMDATRVVETTTGAGNEGIDGMRQQLFSLEIQREQWLSEYQSKHPKARRIEELLQKATDRLRDEEKQRTEKRLGPNSVYLETQKLLVAQRALLDAQDAMVSTLRGQLEMVHRDVSRFADLEMEHNRLSREVALRSDAYKKFNQNLVQARLDDALNRERISNISVAQNATLNHRPVFPNKLINLVAGVFLAACNAIGLSVLLAVRNSTRAKTSRRSDAPKTTNSYTYSNGDVEAEGNGCGKDRKGRESIQ